MLGLRQTLANAEQVTVEVTEGPSLGEDAGVAEELEKKVVRQIALLAGYDPARATGIFTQGGANSTSKCNSRLKIRLLSEVRQKPPVAV